MLEFQYTINSEGTFPNKKVDLISFESQIRASAIIVALDSVIIHPNGNCIVTFKSDITLAEQVLLDNLVFAHTGEPTITDRQPVKLQAFIKTGRERQVLGKRQVCNLNGTTNIDFQWAQEIEIQALRIEISNWTENDYLEAFIVIPDMGQGEMICHQFGKTVYVKPSGILDYGAEETKVVPAGIIIRLVYHSTNTTGNQPIVYADAITWI